MRNKLEKFLNENGFTIKYNNLLTCEHYGGRSFYNDGTYQEEVYKVSKGDKYYFVHDKCTGRPMFTLKDKDYHILFLDFSQNGFIQQFKRYINHI